MQTKLISLKFSHAGEIPLLERQSQLQADRVPPQVRPGHERHRPRDNPQFRFGVAGSEEVRPQHAQGLWLWEEGNSSWSHFTIAGHIWQLPIQGIDGIIQEEADLLIRTLLDDSTRGPIQ